MLYFHGCIEEIAVRNVWQNVGVLEMLQQMVAATEKSEVNIALIYFPYWENRSVEIINCSF